MRGRSGPAIATVAAGRQLRASMSAIVLSLALLTFGLAGCERVGFGVDVFADRMEWIRFGGLEYSGGSASGYAVDEQDLEPIGDAEHVAAAVDGSAVFSLRGVAPTDIVVMRSALDGSVYSIFFRNGRLPNNPDFDDVARIPGMCRYMADLVPSC